MLYSKFKGITSTRSESAISWRERERERERDRQTDRQTDRERQRERADFNQSLAQERERERERADFNQSLTQALLDLSLFQKLSICNNHFYTVWIDIYHLQSNKSQSVIDSFNSALS